MSTTITLAARRVLAGALAAAALTTGVGLAGSGIAEAAPMHQTCLANVHGTITVTDQGRVANSPITNEWASQGRCSSPGQDPYLLTYGSAAVGDASHAGWSTQGAAGGFIEGFDATTGAVDVGLSGTIRNGPSSNPAITAGGFNHVTLKGLRAGRGYEIDEVTVDRMGRKISTRMFFDLETS